MGDSIPLPEYETQGSAGLDLRACLEGKLILKANTSQLIPIGFAMYLEDPGSSGFSSSKIRSRIKTWNCFG